MDCGLRLWRRAELPPASSASRRWRQTEVLNIHALTIHVNGQQQMTFAAKTKWHTKTWLQHTRSPRRKPSLAYANQHPINDIRLLEHRIPKTEMHHLNCFSFVRGDDTETEERCVKSAELQG